MVEAEKRNKPWKYCQCAFLLSRNTWYSRCMLTANLRFAIVCLSSLVVLEWVFGSLRPQRAGRDVRKNALRRWLMVVSHSKNV